MPYSAGEPGLLDGFTRMKVLQTESAGVGWILPHVPAGVTVCDASGPHDQSTAEWVLAAILARRQIPWYARQQEHLEWSPKRSRARRPAGAPRRCRLDRPGRGADAVGLWVDDHPGRPYRTRGGSLLRGAAVTPARRRRGGPARTTDRPHLGHGRRGVSRCSAGRRPRRQRVSGCRRRPGSAGRRADNRPLTAALDVTSPEPLPADHPLWRAPGVLITPHVGGDTFEVHPRLRTFVREQVARYVAGEPLLNVVENGY